MRFDTLLIANRGEIALRVIRTAREMGLRTVAVYSDADAHSPHVQAAHMAVRIGPAAADQSYRNIAAILEARHRSGAQAVHPGYGFLSENPEFAQAVVEAGFTFVGPTARVIALMGNKAAAKQTMEAAGVPTVPGARGCQSIEDLQSAAQSIGYPVILKAAAGGGGRGMRVVRQPADLPELFRQASSEASSAFGSDEIILERAIESGRHIEVQVLCDEHGNCLHLGERDCSTQRRFQKLIEEAPSPAVDALLRSEMGEVARRACSAIGYTGAGTLEFLLDDQKRFYFMEMNTRLQVEHGVTELVTGLDLVEQQIRIAQGAPLAFRQEDVQLEGHAIELRVCAEDPWNGYLPQVGTVGKWQAPTNIRTDSALHDGSVISPFYDSMVAKLLAYGESRQACIARLRLACDETTLLGVRSNLGFLQRCLEHPRFMQGAITTDFLSQENLDGPAWQRHPSAHAQCAAAFILGGSIQSHTAISHSAAPAPRPSLVRSLWIKEVTSPPSPSGGGADLRQYSVTAHGNGLEWRIVSEGGVPPSRTTGTPARQPAPAARECRTIRNLHCDFLPGAVDITLGFAVDDLWRQLKCYRPSPNELWVQDGADTFIFEWVTRFASDSDALSRGGVIKAPMSARVIAVMAEVGQTVSTGEPLVVLESMKMEMPMLAPCDGVVTSMNVAMGEQLASGAPILEVQAHEANNEEPA